PIGDCNAPFPPPQATLFVDPNGPSDATHFQSIEAAVLAAPAGATVAVEAGTYVEALQPLRDVEVVGRCAEKVIVQSPGMNNSGVRIKGLTASVSGLTLRGHYTGAAVSNAGKLTVTNCLFDSNRTLGVTVDGAGSQVTVADSAIRNSLNDASGF